MKKILKIIVVIVIIAILAGAAYWYHTKTVNEALEQQKLAQEQQELLEERMREIQGKLNSSEEENQSLIDRIDKMIAEEVYYFDSAAMSEEIKGIGELATVEYRYTNVGTLDSKKTFGKTNIDIPGSKKTAIVTMDGIIKVGIDLDKVEVACDEEAKKITITIPEPHQISNELDENSLLVYDESAGVFTKITLEDSSKIRDQIKKKAEQNASDNGIYEQATDNAQSIIRCMLESIPKLKETYKIEFK